MTIYIHFFLSKLQNIFSKFISTLYWFCDSVSIDEKIYKLFSLTWYFISHSGIALRQFISLCLQFKLIDFLKSKTIRYFNCTFVTNKSFNLLMG